MWLFDLLESKNKNVVCGCLNAFDALTLLITCVYFKHNKDWFYLHFTLTSVGLLSFLVLMFFVPESPKWLLIKGRKAEAIEVFNRIAAMNLTRQRIPSYATFVEAELVLGTDMHHTITL